MDNAINANSSRSAQLEIRVRSIAHGWISAIIASDEARTDLLLDDVTDPVFELVDWAKAIQSGAAATLQLRGEPWTRLTAEPASTEDRRLRIWDKDDAGRPVLDVCVSTPVLVEALRNFLDQVERHPCFASNWVCFMGLPDEQYDHLGDEADRLWEQGVSEGRWPDDWDQQKDFEARYVADRIKLTTEQVNAVDCYRIRLRAAVKLLQSNGL